MVVSKKLSEERPILLRIAAPNVGTGSVRIDPIFHFDHLFLSFFLVFYHLDSGLSTLRCKKIFEDLPNIHIPFRKGFFEPHDINGDFGVILREDRFGFPFLEQRTKGFGHVFSGDIHLFFLFSCVLVFYRLVGIVVNRKVSLQFRKVQRHSSSP